MTTNNGTKTTKTLLEDVEISDEMAGMLARMESQKGDPRQMTDDERAGYVATMCRALRLNPLTRPVQFLLLNGRELLYITRTATDQLAAMHGLNRETIDGPRVIDLAGTKLVFAVCRATLPNGRIETATATVPLVDPVNVLMKCETKAKRRATLSILGLGVLAEDEVETIPGAQRSTRNDAPTTTAQEPPQRPANPLEGRGIEAPASRPQNAAETPAQRDHIREATAYVGGDNPTLGEHNRAVAEAQAMPAVPAWRVALDTLADEVPSLAPFCNDVEKATLPSACGDAFRKHRAIIGVLSDALRERAWKVLCERCIDAGQKNAKAWLKRYIAETDAKDAAKAAQTDAPAATEVTP